jgi:hypothetical protein
VSDPAKQRLLLRAGVAALTVLVGLVAWLSTRGDGGAAATEASSRIVSRAELNEAAAALGQPIYWAGAIPGTELELEELGEGGGARVRYLPQGKKAGGGSASDLAIGSYPLSDPVAALQSFANRPGSIVRHGSGGGEVISSEERPTSVYFVGSDEAVQVEVYDPSARRAMRLALSGRVQPVR